MHTSAYNPSAGARGREACDSLEFDGQSSYLVNSEFSERPQLNIRWRKVRGTWCDFWVPNTQCTYMYMPTHECITYTHAHTHTYGKETKIQVWWFIFIMPAFERDSTKNSRLAGTTGLGLISKTQNTKIKPNNKPKCQIT